MTTPADDKLFEREFLALLFVSSLFFLGMGAMNALLPKFVVDELSGTETTAGLVMGAMAVSALLTRFWFGRQVDIRGARWVMVVGSVIAALSFVLLASSQSTTLAIVARLITGAGNAAVVTASTLLAIELAPLARRSQAASFILISFHAGMGLGPVLAEAVLEATSYPVLWLVSGAVVGSSAVFCLLLSPSAGDSSEPGALVHWPAVGPGLTTLFGVFSFNGFLMFLPLYGREIGLQRVGLVFTVTSVTIIVVRVLFGRVPDLVGPLRAGTFALVVTAGAAFAVAYWATPTGVFVGAALLACGLSLQSPSFIAIAVEGVGPRERGAAMATYTAFFDIANTLIGPVLGWVVGGYGYQPAWVLGGAMALVALVLLHLVVAPRYRSALARRTVST